MAKSIFNPIARTIYLTKTCYLAIKKWTRATMPGCPVKFLLNSFQPKNLKLLSNTQPNAPLPSLQDKDVQTMLADLQGNILSGHGRFHAAHVFLQFVPGKEKEARNWIAFFAEHAVTSAQRQFQNASAYRELKFDDGTFAHIALSNAGLNYLQVTESQRPVPANLRKRGKEVAHTNVFAQGAKMRQDELLDPAVSAWEPGFQTDIHSLVILGNDTRTQLDVSLRGLSKSLAGIATICTIEYGETVNRRFEKDGKGFTAAVEHFGYRDGKSQPLFFVEQIKQEEKEGGASRYSQEAALSLVLVNDPLGTTRFSYGSFLVYRKLEQNVKNFHETRIGISQELDIDPELVGAFAVGRFEDGTPVVDHKEAQGNEVITNDFNFDDDPTGSRCPIFAHIRKSNPRHDSVANRPGLDKTIEEERGHRIARRGIPYGGRLSDLSDLESLPENGVGLNFICYQSDIHEQFEFIQRRWLNNPRFLMPMKNANTGYDVTGLDPLVGQKHPTAPGAAKAPANWPKGWGEETVKVELEMSHSITMKGGEYFFSPSISALKALASLNTSGG